MAHIKVSETRAEATPKEWLGVGRDVGQLANMLMSLSEKELHH